MEVVVTSAEMQACDRFAINNLRIPSLLLMENAGRGVVEKIQKHVGSLHGKSILIACGKGNNGGDGFVVARHLYNLDANVTVVVVGKAGDLKGDAKINYQAVKVISKVFHKERSLDIVELKSSKKLKVLPKVDIIIDGIFGTGFTGNVRGIYKDVIEWINNSNAFKVSIDIPSGISADNGEVGNVAVKADVTVTMGLKKIGLITGKGRGYSHRVEVVDIGIPKPTLEKKSHTTLLVDIEDVKRVLPHRPFDAHKHSVGKIFVLAGSKGLTGAAAMASTSAMKAGAGAVILGTASSVYPILAKKLTEVMVEPLPEIFEGSISLSAYPLVQKHYHWPDVVIIGPGLSRNKETQQLVWKIVAECNKPLLLDADALNALAEKISVLKKHKSKEVIITPHTGELSRLTGISSEEIERNRVSFARQVAKQFKLTIVLKGAPTVTASEDGKVYINSTGNPGMATAGAGDVLAGLIGGLWAQGMNRTEAAYTGVFLHGYAGDIAKEKYGEKSLLATDILNLLPESILQIERAIVK